LSNANTTPRSCFDDGTLGEVAICNFFRVYPPFFLVTF